jgi:hypothetical protein
MRGFVSALLPEPIPPIVRSDPDFVHAICEIGEFAYEPAQVPHVDFVDRLIGMRMCVPDEMTDSTETAEHRHEGVLGGIADAFKPLRIVDVLAFVLIDQEIANIRHCVRCYSFDCHF